MRQNAFRKEKKVNSPSIEKIQKPKKEVTYDNAEHGQLYDNAEHGEYTEHTYDIANHPDQKDRNTPEYDTIKAESESPEPRYGLNKSPEYANEESALSPTFFQQQTDTRQRRTHADRKTTQEKRASMAKS